ncbi:MAG: hypothetical protein GY937_00520 [bacterium]|nr:hypothetical protein [bacterium]
MKNNIIIKASKLIKKNIRELNKKTKKNKRNKINNNKENNEEQHSNPPIQSIKEIRDKIRKMKERQIISRKIKIEKYIESSSIIIYINE